MKVTKRTKKKEKKKKGNNSKNVIDHKKKKYRATQDNSETLTILKNAQKMDDPVVHDDKVITLTLYTPPY